MHQPPPARQSGCGRAAAGSRSWGFSWRLLSGRSGVWCSPPPRRSVPGGLRNTIPTITRLAILALLAALVGDLVALLVQAAESGGPYFSSLKTTLFDTRYGELWMLRIGLLGLLAALLSFVSWVWPWRKAEISTFAFIASLALVVPFSFNSHASAQTSGRAFAIRH